MPELAAGADVFLSEAAFLEGPGLPPDIHLTARQAGCVREPGRRRRLVLTHLVTREQRGRCAGRRPRAEFAGVLERGRRAGQVIGLGE